VRRVRIRGLVASGREVRVTPRTPPTGAPQRLIPADSGSAGYLSITPLQRPDGSYVLLIRGWYPSGAHGNANAVVGEGELQDRVFAGILRESEKPGEWAVKVRQLCNL
jgi:cytochrome oxidase assembly protein ShyY1